MGDKPEGNSAPVKLDPAAFYRRLQTLYTQWKEGDEQLWKGADALTIVSGEEDDELVYQKSLAMQTWLLGSEYPETIIVLTENKVFILSNQRRVKILENLQKATVEGNKLPVELLTKNKDDNSKSFETLITGIRESNQGKNVGIVLKDKFKGAFANSWTSALSSAEGLTTVDITAGYADVLSVKEQQELRNIKNAASISSSILKNHLVPLLEVIIDENQTIKHSTITEKMEELFTDPTKISSKLSADTVDSCYAPIIQSGGEYDLRPSAQSDDSELHFGTIICSLGARYKSYCSNVARTYFVDPKPEQENYYKILLDLHAALLKLFKPGTKLASVMETAHEFLQSKDAELIPHFVKNCGFGIGLEFPETQLTLNNKNQRVMKAGMVFNFCVGFQDLELKESEPKDSKRKKYAMMLADTVIVTAGEPELVTNNQRKYSDVTYFLEEGREEKKQQPKPAAATQRLSLDEEKRLREKRAISEEDKRKEHQRELARRKQIEAEKRFVEKEKGPQKPAANLIPDAPAYSSPAAFPKEALKHKIFVDAKNEAILVPIYGLLVPFHVSTIKSATKNDEYLRINFVTPGQIMGPKVQTQSKDIPNLAYIREMTFRCSDLKALNNTVRMIKQLRKSVTDRESERIQKAGLKVQEELVLSKARNPRLVDLVIRPNISGRRTQGALEAHKNGIRFSSSKGDHVDILYKNVKHAFFQPAENELIVLIHFHLHHAIMVGKKKTNDIQFYTEAMEVSQALDAGRRSSGNDRDEIEEEQRERAMRAKLNKEFQNFVKSVEEFSNASIEFDMPYRDLGFFGAPGRSVVFLQPTVHALVHLVEPPFFVTTLDEVEIAYFERVQFSLKNFDLVFVFKDFSRPVMHINIIPMDSIDTIKEWLDSCNIKYYEGTQSLNWNKIMQHIREDPKQFWEDGGWNFLNTEDSDEGEAGAQSSEEESDFAPSGDEEEESSDEESDEEGEEEGEEEDSDEYSGGEEEEEEGMDWSDLEEEARKADASRGSYHEEKPGGATKKRRGDYSDEDEPATKQKKTAPKPSSGASKPSSGASKPSSSAPKPSSSAPKPSSSGGAARPPSSNGVKPSSSSSGARPASSSSGNKPSSSSAKPGMSAARPAPSGSKPAPSGGKPAPRPSK